jgi:hypothetical protein
MFEFKIDMKVMIRPDLKQERVSNFKGTRSMSVNSKMKAMAGQTVTISFVDEKTGIHHRIKEDNGEWHWADNMFSLPATEEELFDMLVCGSINEEEYKEYVACLK